MACTVLPGRAAPLRNHRCPSVTSGTLAGHAEYTGFDDFWQPFTLAVGPAGHYLRTLPGDQQAAIRDACRSHVPDDGPFTLPARAWYARGLVPAPPGHGHAHGQHGEPA